jgi:hypothetical protein
MKMRIIFICLTSLLFINCSYNKKKSENEKFINTDSIELTNLTRSVYKWHMTESLDDFPYKYDKEIDTIFVGIDWDKYNNNIKQFEQTNFFSNDFLKSHKTIAMILDTSIKKADIKWRNSNDGISLWETGADNWCGCQDYIDNYWNNITIDSLTIKENDAYFIWKLDKNNSHTYKISANKKDGNWKINSLEGFKHFYTIEDYDKMMRFDKP